MYKNKKYGFGAFFTNTDNIKTPDGVINHTSFNQKSLIGEIYWKDNIKTTAIFSESNGLERTDKWNGGMRQSGFQTPKPYTWDLQRYVFVNNKMVFKDLLLNLGYQNLSEVINDNNKIINSRLNSLTLNGEYSFTDNITVYSSNVIESIDYAVVNNESYSTFKQGARFDKQIGNMHVYYGLGWKQVFIEDLNPFNGVETSLVLGHKGFFTNYTRSLNAPSYLMVKQSITTGKATQIPNPILEQEESNTIRVGYKKKGLYFDVSYRHLINAYSNIILSTDTIQTVNVGSAKVYGSVLGYTNQNLFNKKIKIDSRFEYIYGIDSKNNPINKTVPFSGYLKLGYKGFLVEGRYQTKDNLLSSDDLNDVRIYSHNKGVRLINVGYENSYKHIQYGLLLYNLLNDSSRIYGSSVDLAKRSIQINLKFTL
jgi:hypothetical protein